MIHISSPDKPYADRIAEARAIVRKASTGWQSKTAANRLLRETNTDALRRELELVDGEKS